MDNTYNGEILYKHIMPKVSIIIPVYNQEKYINECLSSVQNQKFNNFETIIVNDGSEDCSVQLIKPFLKDQRFRLINQQNKGVSVARNIGIEKSHGEWLCFVDPDDKLDKLFLTTLLEVANKQLGSEIIASSYYALVEKSNIREHFFKCDFTASTFSEMIPIIHQLMDSSYCQDANAYTGIGVPWGKLYRSAWLRKLGLRFDPNLRRMQDNLFNMEAILECSNFTYIDYPGYFYRVENSIKRSQKAFADGAYQVVSLKRRTLIDKYHLLNIPDLNYAFQEEHARLLIREITAYASNQNRSHFFEYKKRFIQKYQERMSDLNLLDLTELSSTKKIIIWLVLHHFSLLVCMFYFYLRN